jgi:hypothetical protein
VFLRERQPGMKTFVVRKYFECEAIDAIDVREFARKRNPSKRRTIFS